MSVFEAEIKKGNFCIGECPDCKKVVWPPSDYCDKCFAAVKWRKSSDVGKVIEFSKKGDENFCIAEFEEKIRIIGTLKDGKTEPKIGQKVRLDSCSFDKDHYNFTIVLV